MPVWAATALAAAGMALLMLGLPADGFFSGDAGVKVVAARNALAHPRRPFDIDLPTIGGRPVPLADPMIVPHGDHAHELQSPVFPVVSAPLIAVFGLRGAYVLPAVSLVLMVPLLEAMRRVATPATPPIVVSGVALIANPLFFYSLEFWEHAPAVALLAACTALVWRSPEFVRAGDNAAGPGVGLPHPTPPARGWLGYRTQVNSLMDMADDRATIANELISGALGGVAVLLRPEAGLYVMALLVACRPGLRAVVAFAVGAAVVVGPLSIASYAHSGSFLGTHLTNTLAPLPREWFSGRVSRIEAWLWPHSIAEGLGVACLAIGCFAGRFGLSLRTRQTIALIGVVVVTLLAAGRELDRNSLWQAFPVAALAFVPVATAQRLRPLRVLAGLTAVLVVVTATHDGGAQWGPRFLLIVTPPLIVLASTAIADVIAPGSWRPARVTLSAIIFVAALVTNRAAYRELRGAKNVYARIVAATESLTRPGEPIVTNVWWFDQIAAPLYGTRTFVYVPDRLSATQTVGELAAARERNIALVWTKEAEGEPLNTAVNGSCYLMVDEKAIPERQLVFGSASCR